MLRIFVYAILFVLGYRVLKRFFAPDFGEVAQGPEEEAPRQQHDPFGRFSDDKSDVVEDIDYEEIE